MKKVTNSPSFKIASWSLYDLANQFFALNVVSLYFPKWITIEKNTPEIYYSIAFGFSMLLVGFIGPIVGVYSDETGKHRTFLIIFAAISIVFTMVLGVASSIVIALLFFVIANFGCREAEIFYNTLLVEVAPKKKIGLISGLGKMFGYCGAIIALYITKPFITLGGYQLGFFVSGLLYLILALPCFLFVKQKPINLNIQYKESFLRFFKRKQVIAIFKKIITHIFKNRQSADLKYFFIGSFCILCVVNTFLIFMSVFIIKVFGLADYEIIHFIAFATFFAIIGSILSGFISDVIGFKKTLIIMSIFWGITLILCFLEPPFHYLYAMVAGINIGSIWVVSRAFIARVVPQDMLGEMFGAFNFVNYCSSIIGPLVFGAMMLYLSSYGSLGYRLGQVSLLPFAICGIYYFSKMSDLTS
ncbi:MFS transporter [Chlamydiota bacterium]